MSKLTEQQEKALNEYPPIPECNECGARLTKSFCGRCDQFFNEGHKPTCSRMDSKALWTDNHEGH